MPERHPERSSNGNREGSRLKTRLRRARFWSMPAWGNRSPPRRRDAAARSPSRADGPREAPRQNRSVDGRTVDEARLYPKTCLGPPEGVRRGRPDDRLGPMDRRSVPEWGITGRIPSFRREGWKQRVAGRDTSGRRSRGSCSVGSRPFPGAQRSRLRAPRPNQRRRSGTGGVSVPWVALMETDEPGYGFQLWRWLLALMLGFATMAVATLAAWVAFRALVAMPGWARPLLGLAPALVIPTIGILRGRRRMLQSL